MSREIGALRLVAPLIDALLPRACAACEQHATGPLCAACAAALVPAPPGTCGTFCYAGPLATAIQAAKRGDLSRATALAELWVDAVALATSDVDAVTFVPAPWTRLARRGFDLPAVLADRLARARGLTLTSTLALTRRDPPLSSGADRTQRLASVGGRFAVRGAIAGRSFMLVDDVTTTGATLAEATRVLQAAGARVTPCALAATP